MKKGLWILFASLSILIGLYPLLYLFLDKQFGLLSSKSDALLQSTLYNIMFFNHVFWGGLALLIGWTQFIAPLRNKHLRWHRSIGKVYVGAALMSALASLYIALYATGGFIPSMGFTALGIIWFSSTLMAYRSIRGHRIVVHQKMMIYSYAACFAAVTLRIWLPLLTMLSGDFLLSYRIVSWLCWIPNLIVAYFITQHIEDSKISALASSGVVKEEGHRSEVGN